ncbi:Crp/Fnr family transcriptional regulator [Chitinophaga sp. Cy-1792]|uniref:Crp/Fnr family transcriptional regulator n=1 Tax=Chitinophaga sp. Cy-1792 TaxID=2608339 RepID=UPI0014231BAA|nr:Crp/Fnr family transcriptional regulator [Chitinophaga sp. Cy-1792]NIG54726.1 Crp/Fnr family transcriptional regulator [Chitinophaga sp. Cy-1792]
MLRTNEFFLLFIEKLYEQQAKGGHISLKTYTPGEFLLLQQEQPRNVFILKSGITKCYISEDNGKDYIFEFLGIGQIMGELEVIRDARYLCSVEAITAVAAYVVSVQLFRELLQQEQEFKNMVISELADRLYNTCTRISSQQLYTLEHALKNLLQVQEQQQLKISKENMAAYLGVTIRSLNRALKNLQQ